MGRGLVIKPKPAPERQKRQFSIETTSQAKRELAAVRERGTPEQQAEVEKQVSEKFPDLLIERRNPT